MGDIGKRVISGFLFAAAAGVCIFGGVIPVAAGVLVLSTLCLSEFYHIMKIRPVPRGIGYFCNVSLIILVLWHVRALPFLGEVPAGRSFLWIPVVALFFFHFFGHFIGQSEKKEESLQFQSGAALIGFLWISQTLALSILIRFISRGEWWLFLAVAAAAFCDIGAFAVGKSIGRHKLAPALSPGKTIEGLIGGIALSLAASLFLGRYVFLPWENRVVLGLCLAAAAVAGDLAESAWKRRMGVKDSGTMVAGHGGMLDRLDSHLLAIPTLYVYLWLAYIR